MNSEEALVSDYQSKDFIYFQQERQEVLRYIPPQSHTLLEVGCGGGRFGQLLKAKRPVEVWGVELKKHIFVEHAYCSLSIGFYLTILKICAIYSLPL
jgi:hypothetical protein